MEVLGLNKDRAANLENGCGELSGIRRALVMFLHVVHLFAEKLVEGVEIDGVLLCMYRSQVSLQMDGEVGVVAFVGEEGGDAHGSIRSIIVCELRKWQELGPIVLLIVRVYLQILLKHLVHLLSLSISFQVVARGEVEADIKGLAQGTEEMGNKLWTPVGGNVQGNSVFGEHIEKEQLC